MKPFAVRIAGLALAVAVSAASAQEITLRGVSAFPEGQYYTKRFTDWIDKLNADGKGVMRIQFIGGPKAIPSFEQGNALKTGVVDIALIPGPYYTNLMPEADILKLSQLSVAEMRKNGAFDYINKVWNEKANLYYLASTVDFTPFHLYLNKKIDKPDFTGLKIRSTPIYRDVIVALGGSAITTPPGEVYTALERGVVDGYGWPIHQIFDFGWDKKTRYRLDPGFYTADLSILVNLDRWKGMTQRQRDLLTKHAQMHEADNVSWKEYNANDIRRQKESGIEVITFSAADNQRFLDKAYEVGWAEAIKRSPEHAPALRKLLTR
jgi:TRAP-type C4-dicarboxylate transport system substrate-binding protein